MPGPHGGSQPRPFPSPDTDSAGETAARTAKPTRVARDSVHHASSPTTAPCKRNSRVQAEVLMRNVLAYVCGSDVWQAGASSARWDGARGTVAGPGGARVAPRGECRRREARWWVPRLEGHARPAVHHAAGEARCHHVETLLHAGSGTAALQMAFRFRWRACLLHVHLAAVAPNTSFKCSLAVLFPGPRLCALHMHMHLYNWHMYYYSADGLSAGKCPKGNPGKCQHALLTMQNPGVA